MYLRNKLIMDRVTSIENKSFCEVPKYVINTRPHCPKLMKFMDELPK